MSALASLILASLVVMGSPGPSTMSITAVGAAFGFHRSLSYASGLILGTTTVLAAVAAGVVAMLLSLPRLAPALVIASAIYILYLAYKIATAPPLSKQDRAARVPSATGGFLLGIANPKAYFAIAAVFASSNLAVSSRVAEAALKFAVLAVMIVLIHLAWLTAGASLSHLLHHPVRSRIANLMFAAILVATTILAIARS
ncbi:MAG: LysE family transporter [Alphaproteobacteria bacterium]|nr:LysE family transporter [Alphaproteobacteria bacterium]